MQTFVRGQKSKLSDLTPSMNIGVVIQVDGADTYDISCFGVDSEGKLSDDRYFIFFNQPSSPEGAISSAGLSGGPQQTFTIDLSRLPATIHKLVFTATIDGNGTMAGIRGGNVTLSANGANVATFAFVGGDFSAEKALMMAEVYLKDVWRFAAVGQGFNGGLSALLTHFGGEEAAPAAAATPPPPPAPAPTPAAAPKINLGKVTLDKTGDKRTVSLAKGGGNQPVHVNLNWNQQGGTRKRGFLSGGSSAPDLDLGCMWERKDGTKGVIQPLGNRFGSRTEPPFIFLDKDDRSGAASDGENLYVIRPSEIRRVMVFAWIYEGANDFSSVNGRLILRDQAGTETEIFLNNPDSSRKFCCVCLLEESGDSLTITKEERYFKGHGEADGHYGFGFRWTEGHK